MSNHYGLYKNIVIRFAVIDKEQLHLLNVPAFKYKASQIEDSQVKYYKNGFNLVKTSEFIKELSNVGSIRPKTDYVLYISLNSAVIPNGYNIIKTRNRVFMVAPVEIHMVNDGDRAFGNVGLSLDPKSFDNNMLVLNFFTGQGTMTVKTVEMREYKENVSDILTEISDELDPIFDRIGAIVRKSAERAWTDQSASQKLITFIERALAKTGIYSSEAENVRVLLGKSIIDGRSVYEFKVDDVKWESEEDMKFMLDQCNGDINAAKGLRRGEIRLRHLLDNCTLQERLKEMTRDEVMNTMEMNRPNITLVFTDDEIEKYYRLTDREELAQMELMGYERWVNAKKG